MSAVKVQAYSKSELADLYNISIRTLGRWLEKIPELEEEIKTRRILNPKLVGKIFEHLGEP